MPLLLRHHRATVAVAALFVGAPPLATAVVLAEPATPPGIRAQERGRELLFEGERRFGTRCVTRPSAVSMTVRAETTLRVVNRTGFRTRLLLDGVARGELADGTAAEVLFHHGPVTVGLRPLCVFAAESAVRVEVGPPPERPLDPSGGGSAAGRAEPPVRQEDRWYAWPSGLAAASGLAAEPVEPIDPVRDNGPTGLLALVAAICVVGVAAGAVRAIIAQRATRTVVQ